MKQDEGAGGFDLGRAAVEGWLRVRAGAAALMEGAAKVFRCVGVEKKRKSERISLLGYLYAHARPRTRAGARQRARHRNGEVAAAELGQDGVARGGSSCARGGGSRGSWGRHVRRQ